MFFMKKNFLYTLRKQRNLTQRQLAELVNATPGQIYFLESGEKTPGMVGAFIKSLELHERRIAGRSSAVRRRPRRSGHVRTADRRPEKRHQIDPVRLSFRRGEADIVFLKGIHNGKIHTFVS